MVMGALVDGWEGGPAAMAGHTVRCRHQPHLRACCTVLPGCPEGVPRRGQQESHCQLTGPTPLLWCDTVF